MLTEPTSLNRGEGLVTGSPGDVGGVWARARVVEAGGEVEERWWWTNKSEVQPLMELMLNSNSALPHR